MSTFHNPQHMNAPKKPSPFKKPVVWLPIVTAVVAFGLGTGAGGSSTEAATPEPAPTVTVTSPPKIETKTVTVEKTPAACLEALDLSQKGFGYSAEAMGYMSDAMTAAASFDVATIEASSAKLKVLNPKIGALTSPMQTAVAACRAKG